MLTRIPMSQGGNAQSPLRSTQDSEPTISVDIATTTAVGVVKPDGTTVTIAADGTISATGTGGTVTHTGTLTADLPVFGNGTGDIKVGTKSGNTNELATVTGAGASGHLATWDANGNLQDGGAAPPVNLGAMIGNSSAQSIAASTGVQLTLGTVVRDDGGFTGTANKLTVPAAKAGWYIITGNCAWDSSVATVAGLSIFVNGSHPFGSTLPATQGPSSGFACSNASAVLFLNAGDVISLVAFQNNAGTITITDAFLSAALIN